MTRPDTRELAERRRALMLLMLTSLLYAVFACLYLPRLNNYLMSDMEFTGWTGPFATRLLRAERTYLDFVLPIPPGSFVLLAAVQKITGRSLIIQELALIAAIQL